MGLGKTMQGRRGMTLIELLVVLAIIAILAAIGVVNFIEAQERALKSADAANLRTIASALQIYMIDYGKLPLGDQVAGPFSSQNLRQVGNGPAGGGSWNGVPWLLYDLHYVERWETLFCPKYLKIYQGGKALAGGWPRYHNFRYAYNSGSAATGGYRGGAMGTSIMRGDRRSWIVRDLYLPATAGFYGQYAPRYPADFKYPWGPDEDQEMSVWSDLAVRLVVGGSNEPIEPGENEP